MHARRAPVRHALAPARPRSGSGRLLTLVWIACLVTGIVMLGDFAYGMWRGVSDQQHINHVWTYQVGTTKTTPKAIDPSLKRPVAGVDFAIRIPRLGYFAAIKEGVGSGVLYASPGHYPTTRWPGDPGTVGVAAHNVYWINFPELAKGDEIDLETRYGLYRYRLVSTQNVQPTTPTPPATPPNGHHLPPTTRPPPPSSL